MGLNPTSVAAAQLDLDADNDLAVANLGSDDVTILKNAGTGNFFEPGSSREPAGDGPSSVVAQDVDGDDDQDLAVANLNSDDVTILKNRGDGSFFEPASSPEPVGDGPVEVVAAKLDADADYDLAVANGSGSGVTILINNGAGNFSEPLSSPEPIGGAAVALVAADLDGDADQDLAVADQSAGNVAILKNNGAGDFFEPSSSPEPAGVNLQALAVADLDGDADQDLAVASSVLGEDPSFLSILKNRGAGSFFEAASSPEPVGDGPVSVAAADFNANGDVDLVTANSTANTATILRNTGVGNFIEPPTSPEATNVAPSWVTAGDFDLDGDPDLAFPNAGGANDLTVLRNAGTP